MPLVTTASAAVSRSDERYSGLTESQRRFQPIRPSSADGGGTAKRLAMGDQVTIAGRYVIEARIGEGAHAITYRAQDLRLKRTVAVKVLRSHLASDTELVSRFVREAELAASISHPNVVDVYDVGTDGNVSYIVMRLVPGQDLKQVIQNEGRLPVSRANPLIQQILRGLGAIHAAGIVHRDVKPQNIIVTPDGTAQVTDFGVAYAALAEGLTTQGMTVGTASYMAPEQARGEPVTQATDIYAVGVVFYEMLTGRVPFRGENPMAVMLAHLQSRPVPPSEAVPGLRIPPRVEQVILRSMAKEPTQRFPSTGAMAAALAGTAQPGLDDQTTTVGAVAPGPRSTPLLDDRTVVQPAVASYGPPTPVRPVAPPPTLARGSGGSWGRRWVVGLALILSGLLAAGAVAAATQFGPFDRSGDGGNTPALVAAGPSEPAPVVGGSEQPTASATDPTQTPVVANVVVKSTATQTPLPATLTPTPTTEPTATATVPLATATARPPATATVRPPTATTMPTATTVPPTPTPPPTAIPTATVTIAPPTATISLPPTETPAIVQINQAQGRGQAGNGSNGNDGSNGIAVSVDGNDNGGNGVQVDAGGAGGSSVTSTSSQSGVLINIPPSDWQGAYANLDTGMYGRDCVALYGQGSGYESATLTFSLAGTVSNDVTLTLTGIDDEFDAGNPFYFVINGQELQPSESAAEFPQWDGQAAPQFGTIVASFPAPVFVEGQNSITIVNTAPGGSAPDGVTFGPYFLLGEATLNIP